MRFQYVLLLAAATLASGVPLQARQNAGNDQPFTGAVGGIKAPSVTKVGNNPASWQVEGNSAFPSLKSAITRSCDVQNNKCMNAFNSQPNDNKTIQSSDCGAQQQKCNAGDNSGAVSGSSSASSDSATSSASGSATTSAAGAESTTSSSSGSGGNLQPFTGAVGGVKAPGVTNTGGDRPFQVEGNAAFPELKNAITRSCDVQNNKCMNAFNSQPNDNKTIQSSDCGAQQQKCNAGDNSGAVTGSGAGSSDSASATASDSATATASGSESTSSSSSASGENLQTFTGAVGGVKAPGVTNTGGDRPFQVEGNAAFPELKNAITRSCDVQNNKCMNAFNSQPNDNKTIQSSDCGAQQQKCNAGDNSGSAKAAAATAAGGDASSTEAASAATTAGGDASSTEAASTGTAEPTVTAADASVSDASSTASAASATSSTVAATGGKGGIDPATGEKLEALVAESDFCKSQDLAAGDGTQNKKGSCSSTPQGQLMDVDRMPSSLILKPENGAKLKTNTEFEISVMLRNVDTGFFTDPNTEYFTQPQTLNEQGIVRGHTHVTVQELGDATSPPDANTKIFFKGLNDKFNGKGVLSVTVPANATTKPGLIRICSMTGSFSHAPIIPPVAQRGSQDDCIRLELE